MILFLFLFFSSCRGDVQTSSEGASLSLFKKVEGVYLGSDEKKKLQNVVSKPVILTEEEKFNFTANTLLEYDRCAEGRSSCPDPFFYCYQPNRGDVYYSHRDKNGIVIIVSLNDGKSDVVMIAEKNSEILINCKKSSIKLSEGDSDSNDFLKKLSQPNSLMKRASTLISSDDKVRANNFGALPHFIIDTLNYKKPSPKKDHSGDIMIDGIIKIEKDK